MKTVLGLSEEEMSAFWSLVYKVRKAVYEQNNKIDQFREKNKQRAEKHRKNNRESINAKQRERYKNDPIFKLKHSMRKCTSLYMKQNKTKRTIHYLGIDFDGYKKYLEALFEPWMNWDNYGKWQKDKRTWHIDHIVQLNTATNTEELIKLMHYTNTRPLDCVENLQRPRGNKNV